MKFRYKLERLLDGNELYYPYVKYDKDNEFIMNNFAIRGKDSGSPYDMKYAFYHMNLGEYMGCTTGAIYYLPTKSNMCQKVVVSNSKDMQQYFDEYMELFKSHLIYNTSHLDFDYQL